MKSSSAIVVLVLLAAGIIASCSAAPALSFQPGSVSIVSGGVSTLNLTLNEAPEGLAGYDCVVRITNPGTGVISSVQYPAWAVMHNTTALVDGGLRISGTDIDLEIDPGATDIVLATLTVRGISAGSSAVTVSSVNMDADGGGMITPSLGSATLTVTGTGGTSGGGGGGGGGSYYPSTTTQATATPTVAATITTEPTTVPATPRETVTTVSEETPVDGLLSVPDTPVVPGPDATENPQGFPWAWIVAAIVIIAAANLVAVGIMKFRQKRE
ncbi:hypothetical protein J2741_000714 [Methanolinea mesophila]|uniref:hypothetical protein n=1 Tax=Methanolinea mesophila TaxID=547055 RepID=UPI001AE56234|nr:hypothetical protein [Methanolinea mesophila]MBP1928167.1 hypothetical protein [Methanolinea mesophila]